MRGLSLIELMISMVIGLLVVLAAGGLLISSQRTYKSNYAIAEVQDSARAAFELLARDIRNAGDDGCGNLRLASVEYPQKGSWFANNVGTTKGSEAQTLPPAWKTNAEKFSRSWPAAVQIYPVSGAADYGWSTNTLTQSGRGIFFQANILLRANKLQPNTHMLFLSGAGPISRQIVGSSFTSDTVTLELASSSLPFPTSGFAVFCNWQNPGHVAGIKSLSQNQETLTFYNNSTINNTPAYSATSPLPDMRGGIVSEYQSVIWYVTNDGYLVRAWAVPTTNTSSGTNAASAKFKHQIILPDVTGFKVNVHLRSASEAGDAAYTKRYTKNYGEYAAIVDKSRIDALRMEITIRSNSINLASANTTTTDRLGTILPTQTSSPDQIERTYVFYAPILSRAYSGYERDK